jgi:hypothetical protein
VAGAGVRLRATRCDGQGPTVLLLHGLASTRRFWDLIVPARAGQLVAQPRMLSWAGAVHDVPLQWPALVAGLVRAAHDEVVGVRATGEGAMA